MSNQEFSQIESNQIATDEEVNEISNHLISQNLEAYEELAK